MEAAAVEDKLLKNREAPERWTSLFGGSRLGVEERENRYGAKPVGSRGWMQQLGVGGGKELVGSRAVGEQPGDYRHLATPVAGRCCHPLLVDVVTNAAISSKDTRYRRQSTACSV